MCILSLCQVLQSPPAHLPSWWWDLSLLLWWITQRGIENLLAHSSFLYHLSHISEVAESFRKSMAICFLSSHRRRFSISVTSIISFPWLESLSPNCFRWSIEALDKWWSNGNFYELFHKLTEAWELWVLHSTGCSFSAGWIIAHLKKGELISLNYVLAPFWSSLCAGFIIVMWSLIFICKSRRA